jgi:hypothetical protein
MGRGPLAMESGDHICIFFLAEKCRISSAMRIQDGF